jgi:hypothetical protein
VDAVPAITGADPHAVRVSTLVRRRSSPGPLGLGLNDMETSLHRALKELYCTQDSRIEATVRGYRADVLQGELIVEVQASPLGAIARKVADLVKSHRVLVVKPLTRRKVLLRSGGDGEWNMRRLSPKKGKLLDIFDELVHFTRVFPHPNLSVEIILIDEEEMRVPRRRRRFRGPDYRIHDRRLVQVIERRHISSSHDLLDLLPRDLPTPLTSQTLAQSLSCPEWLARKVMYTLRHCGAARMTGKSGNRLIYELEPRRPPGEPVMVAC